MKQVSQHLETMVTNLPSLLNDDGSITFPFYVTIFSLEHLELDQFNFDVFYREVL